MYINSKSMLNCRSLYLEKYSKNYCAKFDNFLQTKYSWHWDTKNIFHFCRNHIQQKCVLQCLEKTWGTHKNIMHVLQNLPTRLMRNPQKRLWIQSVKRQSFQQNLFVQWDEPRIFPCFLSYFFKRTIRVKDWQHNESQFCTYT